MLGKVSVSDFDCSIISCHVMSCHVMSCHVTSRHVMSCHVMSCHVTSCPVISCHVRSVFWHPVTAFILLSLLYRRVTSSDQYIARSRRHMPMAFTYNRPILSKSSFGLLFYSRPRLNQSQSSCVVLPSPNDKHHNRNPKFQSSTPSTHTII